MSAPSSIVVGAGIAGLAAADRLRRGGFAVTVFEASGQAGGAIRTEQHGGYLVDLGPNTLVARVPELEAAITDLDLGDERVWADDAAEHRYVVRDGRPVAVPASPRALLRSPFLSARGKLRLLGEPFARRGRAEDESVAAFVRRRLGAEALAYGADPLVAGVFAGDPERLSVRHAFPMLSEMERAHGSLLHGAMARRHAGKQGGALPPSRRPFSFRDGMQTLPDALAARLGSALRLNAAATAVRRGADGFEVTADGPTGPEAHRADAVVLAVPPHRLPALDAPSDLGPLQAVAFPPVAVVALGFRRADAAHPLDGFGVLVPSREPFRMLGAQFSSTLFPGRAPTGHVLLTLFFGGARHPDDAHLPDDALLDLARTDLRRLLGVRGEPTFVRRHTWARAIPQYELGYGRVLAALEALEEAWPGCFVAGNVRGGISVGEALASGVRAAGRAAERFG